MPEQDRDGCELHEGTKILGIVFPAEEEAMLALNPGKESLNQPARRNFADDTRPETHWQDPSVHRAAVVRNNGIPLAIET
ncbi:MAG: hypothetical protein ABFS24_12300 [Pseudomonadota bacterium]